MSDGSIPTSKAVRFKQAKAKGLRGAVKEKELEIRKRVTENKGTVLLSKSGTKSAVGFTQSELKLFPGNVLTHNHPRGTSFSPDDIALACKVGLKEVRAVGKKYHYSMKPPKDGWSADYWQHVLRPVVAKYDRVVYDELVDAIMKKQITRLKADELYWHEVWKRTGKETGLKYDRRKWK